MFCAISLPAFAQGIAVSGTVTDNTGAALPGVNVVVKGTASGVVSQANGTYSISVPNENAVLQFSFIGYVTQEAVVGNRRTINIVLTEDTQQIEEVVVVGYGTQRKSDVTGSIAVVGSEELLRTPSFSGITGLKGVAPGVNVFVNSGLPGGQQRVVIRGLSSIQAVADPLYVVDGVPMFDFQFVNPNDIERIEVLKDASATAIYGARGSQGVLLITTKRGAKSDVTRVTYSGWIKVATLPKKMDTMNSEEFMRTYRISMQNHVKYVPNPKQGETQSDDDWKKACEAARASRETAMNKLWSDIAQNSSLNPNYYDLFRINGTFDPSGWKNEFDTNLVPIYDTDWQSEATRNALSHSHQLNIQNSTTGVFLNYTDEQGLFLNTYMKRVNARLTQDVNPFKWLTTSVNLMVNHSWQNETEIGSGGQDALRTVIELPPIFPVKYPDGVWSNSTNKISGFGFEALSNPVHFLTVRDRNWYRTQVFGNVGLTFHLADGLDLKTQFGADGQIRNYRRYYPWGVVNMDSGGKGQAQTESTDYMFWQETTYLNYRKVLDKHRISAMVGVEWSERVERFVRTNTINFPTNAFGYYNLLAGTEPQSQESGYDRWALNSYIGRLGYTFNDKYMATLTARVDGNSRFGANNKYAFFPAAGLGWLVSNEEFMKNLPWLNTLKLHTSYGVTGNSEGLGTYRSLAVYSTGQLLLNGTRVSSANPARMANPDLRWEKQSQWDIGFNLNMFGNRLNFDISYYYKYTDDLLLDAPIPHTSGYNTIAKNVGAISNRGWDILVNGTIISAGDFEWNATINANYNTNKVEKLNEGNADVFVGDNWVGAQVVMQVGQPLGCWWGLERTGIRTDPATGRVGVALRSPGKTNLGRGMPDWMGSFMNKFSYKNIDFMVDFQYAIGGKIRQDFYHSTEDRFGLTSGLRSILYDSWREGEPSDPNRVQAIRNAVFDGSDSNMDTRWLCDASYFRLNLLQLGYNFTPTAAKFIGISGLRAYASVENVFILHSKEFQGYDPEASSRGRFEQNAFFFQYPRPRTFSVGINVTF